MKHALLLFLVLLFHSGLLLAAPLPAGNTEQLQNLIELFTSESSEEAVRQLELREAAILEAIGESNDPHAYLLLGRLYFYAEMDSKAMSALSTALEYDASLSDAHFYTGLVHKYAGDLDRAERSFRNATESGNPDAAYFVELGIILEAKEDTSSALDAYKRALEIESSNFDANFRSANIHATNGANQEAEGHYLAALRQNPNNVECNYNLGQLYQNTEQNRLAVEYFSKVIELDPIDWRTLTKIVQASQALSDVDARDAAVDSIYEIWREGTSHDLQKQGFYVREQVQIESGKVFALEYFELKGEYARKFVFKLIDPATGEHRFDVSLGSYEATNTFSRELGRIGTDERVYHLDGYGPDGSHYTFAFFESQPKYDVVREIALDAFSGKLSPISSTTPSYEEEP